MGHAGGVCSGPAVVDSPLRRQPTDCAPGILRKKNDATHDKS